MKALTFMAVVLLMTTTGLMAQTKAGKADTSKHTTLYSCPKHPDVTNHAPGKCAKCGMELGLSGKEQMKAAHAKTYTCPVHVDVKVHNPGNCPKCGKKLHFSAKEQMKAGVTKAYTCTMHPDVALDKEGNCPKCGKVLVEKKTSE